MGGVNNKKLVPSVVLQRHFQGNILLQTGERTLFFKALEERCKQEMRTLVNFMKKLDASAN